MIKKLPIYISLLVIYSCAKDTSEDDSSAYVSTPSNPYSDQSNYLEWEIISSQLIKVN